MNLIGRRTAIFDDRHPDRNKDSRVVRTIPLRDDMLSKCRGLDSWAKQVKGRLENCIYLLAAEAVYHRSCHACFCSSKDLTYPSEKRKSLGRPQKHSVLSAFNNLYDWLEEEEGELHTLGELHEAMTEMTENENEYVYFVKRLKQKLQDRYRDHLFFGEVSGRKNVVCFCDMASLIINDKWYEAKRDKY